MFSEKKKKKHYHERKLKILASVSTRKRHLVEKLFIRRDESARIRFNIARNAKLKDIYSFVSPQLSYQNNYITTIFERCYIE